MTPAHEASCLDAPPAPAIDVVALSVDLPDGVYYAGRRHYRMTAAEQRELRNLAMHSGIGFSHNHSRRLEELLARNDGSTTVVRWSIEDGVPSSPVRIVSGLMDGIVEPARRRPLTWGDAADGHLLVHALLDDVLKNQKSTNDYYDAFAPICASLKDEWILFEREIQHVIAKVELRAAARAVDTAIRTSLAAGMSHAEIEAVFAEAQIAVRPGARATSDRGTLINKAASLGARAVTAREAAERMPRRTPAELDAREAALARADEAQQEANAAWDRARIASPAKLVDGDAS